MKKFLLIALISGFAAAANAQIKNPVKWSFTAKKIDAKTYEVQMTASMDPGWHIYTLEHTDDIGVATSITVNKNPLGTASGKIKVVGKPVKKKDPSTGEMVSFYQGQVTFVQTIKLSAPVTTTITGEVEYMTCDDKQCLPPTAKSFSVALK